MVKEESGLSRAVVLVWLDSLAGDLFTEMYEGGELPNLEEFFEEGSFVRSAISCFPTVSESTEGGVISGFFSGETNMLGERYFSRKLRRMCHYKYGTSPSLDFNPELRDLVLDTVAGSSVGIGRLIYIASERVVDLIAEHYERTGSLKLVRRRIETASKVALLKRPRLLFFTVSADYISHVSGRRSLEVRRFVKEFDREFPALVEALDAAYGRGRYAIFVFSDHGSSNISRHLDLPNLLSELGFHPATSDLIIERDDADSAAFSNGRRMGLVYIRLPYMRWDIRPSYKRLRNYPLRGSNVDIPRLLAEEEGVAQVFLKRDEHSVTVISREGEALIEHNPLEEKYRYSVVKGEDPLEYNIVPGWMSEEEWLKLTYDRGFPDGVVQLYNMLKSDNCGDLVLNAAEGWDFWEPWDVHYPALVASHGGLSRDEMSTFILARGPRIENKVLPYARVLDIFATAATCYGRPDISGGSHAVERLVQH